MMKRVAAFHHKHDFAGNNGHDMGYRIALTVEELGELAAAITKNKPIEEVAEEMADVLILLMGHSLAMNIDLKASFEAKVDKIMQRPARKGTTRNSSYRIHRFMILSESCRLSDVHSRCFAVLIR